MNLGRIRAQAAAAASANASVNALANASANALANASVKVWVQEPGLVPAFGATRLEQIGKAL